MGQTREQLLTPAWEDKGSSLREAKVREPKDGVKERAEAKAKEKPDWPSAPLPLPMAPEFVTALTTHKSDAVSRRNVISCMFVVGASRNTLCTSALEISLRPRRLEVLETKQRDYPMLKLVPLQAPSWSISMKPTMH